MAFGDIFKTRRSARIYQQAWQIIWQRVKTPPAEEAAKKELHVVFVGTLLYATRFQAALAAGMEETMARAVALQVVAHAGFDEQMRDKVLSVFSVNPESGVGDYAATLNSLIAAIIEYNKAGSTARQGASLEELLAKIEELLPVLGRHLSTAG